MPIRKSVPSNVKTPDIGSIYKKSLEKKKSGKDVHFETVSGNFDKSNPNSSVYDRGNNFSPEKNTSRNPATTKSGRRTSGGYTGVRRVLKNFSEHIECKVESKEYLTNLAIERELGGTIYAYQVLLLASGESLVGYVGNGLFRKSDIESNPHIASNFHGYEIKDSAKNVLENTKDGKYGFGTIIPTDYGKAHMTAMRKAIEAANKKRTGSGSS